MLVAVRRSVERIFDLVRHKHVVGAWKDPVWSKVIATGITALIGTLVWLVWHPLASEKATAIKFDIEGPRLSIVDVFTSDDNTVEFKLKNSGDDSAFLKSIQFVFEAVSVACHDCMTEIAAVYAVRATINGEHVLIEPNYKDAEAQSSPSTERNPLSRPSQIIKISESIASRGVGAFRVRFEFGFSDGLFINRRSVRAYAIIAFDSHGQLTTPFFSLSPGVYGARTVPATGDPPPERKLSALGHDQQNTGLVAGGTVLRGSQSKPFVEKKHDWGFPFTRDFKELLDVAQTSDIDGLPKIAASKIKRIDFKPYSGAELVVIKERDTKNLINCPGFCRFRKATVERVDGNTEDVFLYCIMETLYGPENEQYFLGNQDIQAVMAR